MSRLSDALGSGNFVVTGEVAPPVGTDLSGMRSAVEMIGPHCDAVNVTDNQGAALHLSSLGASYVVLEMGFEPVHQVTCRDRNRLALQSDLLAAWTLGLENLLLLTGDDPRSGDHPQAKGVFDLDSTQLIEVAAGMNDGHDMLGRDLEGGTGFCIGAAVFPEVEPWDAQLARAQRKVEAGARFFQTQAVFDMDKLERCVDALRPTGVKVLAGILLLRSPRVVDFINLKLGGLMVPDAVADRIRGAVDPEAECIDLAAEQVLACRDIADGVHIMPLGLDEAIPKVLRQAGLV